jgi:hypothetical protein
MSQQKLKSKKVAENRVARFLCPSYQNEISLYKKWNESEESQFVHKSLGTKSTWLLQRMINGYRVTKFGPFLAIFNFVRILKIAKSCQNNLATF